LWKKCQFSNYSTLFFLNFFTLSFAEISPFPWSFYQSCGACANACWFPRKTESMTENKTIGDLKVWFHLHLFFIFVYIECTWMFLLSMLCRCLDFRRHLLFRFKDCGRLIFKVGIDLFYGRFLKKDLNSFSISSILWMFEILPKNRHCVLLFRHAKKLWAFAVAAMRGIVVEMKLLEISLLFWFAFVFTIFFWDFSSFHLQ
jgi:hypothetical protein